MRLVNVYNIPAAVAAALQSFSSSLAGSPLAQARLPVSPAIVKRVHSAVLTANGSFTLPAKGKIVGLVIQENAGNAITGGLKFGTTNGGTEISATLAVPASTKSKYSAPQDFTQPAVNDSASRLIYYAAVTAWNGATITIDCYYEDYTDWEQGNYTSGAMFIANIDGWPISVAMGGQGVLDSSGVLQVSGCAASTVVTNANLTGPITSVGNAVASLTDKAIVVGAGTAAVTGLAPGTSGNVATSDGTRWTSAAPVISGGPNYNTGYHLINSLPGFSDAEAFAHGLGAVPTRFEIYLKCTTAQWGYSVGDITKSSSVSLGAALDATNVTVLYTEGTITVLNKTTGGSSTITSANWNFIVYVWL